MAEADEADPMISVTVAVNGRMICRHQVQATGGNVTFYTSWSTYPSGNYYEVKITATPGFPAVIYIPQPANATNLYCNVEGSNTSTNATTTVLPGGCTAILPIPPTTFGDHKH